MKTKKKAPAKKKTKTAKKTAKKLGQVKGLKAKVLQAKRTSKKIADEVLLRMGPSVQTQVNKLKEQIVTQSENIQDFKVMGLRVLQKAKEMTDSLKKDKSKVKPSKTKKR